MGVWIEIPQQHLSCFCRSVTPLVGVWIEIKYDERIAELQDVTPLVGVWIEILRESLFGLAYRSLPLWECGLKYHFVKSLMLHFVVTPLVGVWIEIISITFLLPSLMCHSPCGSVD